ncbi:MAG: hypothetical protein KatS3mg023_3893 [Armatimonadota bacterium]|nr:MAG: hypothetical protein KatS3mg023_3893 [Armatimonadota bacterium]
MPNFAPSVHYDKILSEVSIRYSQDGYIATRVFPALPVVKESDLIDVYDRENVRIFNDLRADGATAHEIDWGWTLRPYFAQEHALRHLVTDRALKNVDEPIDLFVDTTEHLTDMLMLAADALAASIMLDPNNNVGATNANWTNYSTASPKTDIMTAKNAIFTASGRQPNVMIVPSTVANRMTLIQEIKEERKYVNDLTQSGLPRNLWGLEVVEVALIRNTAQPGQSPSFQELWSDNIWIGYVDPNPRRKMLTYGLAPTPRPRTVRTYRDEARAGTWVEVSWIYDFTVVARECGYILQSVFTA